MLSDVAVGVIAEGWRCSNRFGQFSCVKRVSALLSKFARPPCRIFLINPSANLRMGAISCTAVQVCAI
jgi:hypothetical protein